MIEATEAFKERLYAENNKPIFLVSIHLANKTEYVTDSPYLVVYNGRNYRNDAGFVTATVPSFDGRIDRGKLTLTLVDHDGVWYKEINHSGLGSVVEIVLAIEDVDGMLLPDSITLYKGRISSVSVGGADRGGRRSRVALIYCTGPFNKLNSTRIRRTTQSSQQQVDPTDTFFDEVSDSDNPRIIQW